MKGLQLYFFGKPETRFLSRFNSAVPRETRVEVIGKLAQLVEQRIAYELDGTKGATLLDG